MYVFFLLTTFAVYNFNDVGDTADVETYRTDYS